MITEEQLKEAEKIAKEAEKIVKEAEKAVKVVTQYYKERTDIVEAKIKNHRPFTDDELRYSANFYCSCGHGLAYPKDCSVNHYWDCSAILKGIADKEVEHTSRLPFAFYSIKGESEERGSTRPKIKEE